MQFVREIAVTSGDVLRVAASLHERHESRTPLERRKERGQFFTPTSVAAFMARLFSTPPRRLRVLDAGAGTGTLSTAICQRILQLRSPRIVECVLFETDASVLPLLDENMRYCRAALRRAGHDMTYSIEHADFILSHTDRFGQAMLFGDDRRRDGFDAVIMNPPYFKLNKDSLHARAFEGVIRGQPNIYALFMASGAAVLRPGGELVAITPRSFCNGLYFREFRRWLLPSSCSSRARAPGHPRCFRAVA